MDTFTEHRNRCNYWLLKYHICTVLLYNFTHFDFSYCGKVDCPEKSVREILDAGDFWHLSWEPQCLKELKQLHSRQLCVFEHQQAHKQYPHHSWSHVVFLSILWFDSNAENKGACVPASYNADSLYHRLPHSLFSPKLSGVLQVQTLIKWCRKLYPTPRNTHPDSMHAFPAHGGWTSSPYLCHKFPSRLLVLSAPLCFASWIFSFPALQAKHKQRSGCE